MLGKPPYHPVFPGMANGIFPKQNGSSAPPPPTVAAATAVGAESTKDTTSGLGETFVTRLREECIFLKCCPLLLQQIRNPSIALTAARSSAIFRASSLTSSTCTPRIQSTRAKLAERASRPNQTSQRTGRFTQVRSDRPTDRDQAKPLVLLDVPRIIHILSYFLR